MRRAMMPGCLLAVFLATAANAAAEAIVVTSTTFSTSGTFDCRATVTRTGEGTDTITFGSGDNTATIRFLGLSSTFDVTNTALPVTIGAFEVTASDGFTFPVHQTNPVQLPILRFFLTMTTTGPQASTASRLWEFGPGGGTTLPIEIGYGYFAFPLGDGFGYDSIVYTVKPFPFTLSPGGVTAVTADVGAVPEPASMVLLGTGLAGAIAARRRRKLGRV